MLEATAGIAVNAISLSKHSNSVAVAGSAEIKIFNIDTVAKKVTETNYLLFKSTGNFTVTDVVWCNCDAKEGGKIAASASNGHVQVFNAARSSKGKTEQRLREWNNTEASRFIHKLSWHAHDPNIIAAACQDGVVRTFDCRRDTDSCHQKYSHPHSSAARSLQFNPINPNVFASVHDSGALLVWDLRRTDSALLKISAHMSNGLSLDWHPHNENIIATGASDKYINIWDVNRAVADESSSLAWMVSFLNTSSISSHLAWKRVGHRDFLAVSSRESSDISLWDVQHTNAPLCILRGGGDSVVGFDWWLNNACEGSTPEELCSTAAEVAAVSSEALLFQEDLIFASKAGGICVKNLERGYFPYRYLARGAVAAGPLRCAGSASPDGSCSSLFVSSAAFGGAYSQRAFRVGQALLEVLADSGPLDEQQLRSMRGCVDVEYGCGQDELLPEEWREAAMWRAALVLVSSRVEATGAGSSSSKTFVAETCVSLLMELLDSGDIYPFVILSELMQHEDVPDRDSSLSGERPINRRKTEAYRAYVDTLRRQRLFKAATLLIKITRLEEVSSSSAQGLGIFVSCTACGKEVPEQQPFPYCDKCRRSAALCSVCHKAVRGLYHRCPMCGHGGHVACTDVWFQRHSSCPSGCSHNCKLCVER